MPKGKVWIEYLGLEDEKYLKRKELKKELYKKHGKELIELTNKDIENLDDIQKSNLFTYYLINIYFCEVYLSFLSDFEKS
jgi:hypothetical protein